MSRVGEKRATEQAESRSHEVEHLPGLRQKSQNPGKMYLGGGCGDRENYYISERDAKLELKERK
jgi:hypothetical protein